jgi:hypothetical protein
MLIRKEGVCHLSILSSFVPTRFSEVDVLKLFYLPENERKENILYLDFQSTLHKWKKTLSIDDEFMSGRSMSSMIL